MRERGEPITSFRKDKFPRRHSAERCKVGRFAPVSTRWKSASVEVDEVDDV